MTNHLISVLVENKPGVLARISSMFARRGFNIHSLAVGPTSDPDMSRMTVVVDAPEMEQIVKQLRKLINTVKVTELGPGDAIEREIMLVRVNAEASKRAEIFEVAQLMGAHPADVGASTITFEIAGAPDRLATFFEMLRPYGISDLVKSGRIALGKTPARNA
ncbi:MAG: acetolactate synthase small subunit [Acidimicrobiia bacterium]|nr:acetolactate synthase small subunit [Acidimicrobiia bacterium]NNF68614.1 acetolactate synthase small subunit [Acidimicrobiia bacterium]NNK91647.1 acetolactate synthase small subunit [Acidimicrobiia bacterium]